jgi:hypothetical protein
VSLPIPLTPRVVCALKGFVVTRLSLVPFRKSSVCLFTSSMSVGGEIHSPLTCTTQQLFMQIPARSRIFRQLISILDFTPLFVGSHQKEVGSKEKRLAWHGISLADRGSDNFRLLLPRTSRPPISLEGREASPRKPLCGADKNSCTHVSIMLLMSRTSTMGKCVGAGGEQKGRGS